MNIESLSIDKDAAELVDAYIRRFVALAKLGSGNGSMQDFLVADRRLWSGLVSNRYGGMFAAFVGSGVVAFADAVVSLAGKPDEEARMIFGNGHIAMINAAVDLIIRVAPSKNSSEVRTALNQYYQTLLDS